MRRSPSSLQSLSRLSTLALSTLIFSTVCQAQSLPLMTRHVREVVVNGQAPLVGPLPATQSLLFDIVLPLRDRPGLQSFIREQHDPASPYFHQFLTPQEVTARFGPSQANWDALVAFAKASGFEIIGGTRDGRDLQLSGTVANIEKAFHVTMGVYQDPTEDRTFFAIDREPTVDLPFQLWHITGLDNDSKPHPMYVKKSDYAKAHGIDPDKIVSNATTGSGPDASFLGSDMRAAYYGGTALTGSGQNIALFEFLGTDLTDLTTYYSSVGQTEPYTPTLISTGGYGTSCIDSHAGGFCDDTEQTLDMTQAMGMAPGSTMLYMYVCGNAESISDTDCLSAMVTNTDAPLSMQISSSWSWSPADPSIDDPYFEQMASQGQNFFVAAGDNQAWSSSVCCVYPADDVNVVAVGGTDLTTSSAAGPWASETAWIDSGGGISPDDIAIPSWQALAGVITLTNQGSTTLRNGPDVSANANFSFYVCADQTTCTANDYGGTSFAAPMWAGYLALANQQAVANSETISFINPIIYPDALTSSYSTLFHDVTSGSCGTYSAVTDFDLCTGWGSPNGSGLINALAPALSTTTTTLASSQNPQNQGASVTFTATVTTSGSNTPTGTVTFYNGNTSIGTGTLSGSGNTATATLATSSLPVGTNSITAGYGGDSNNAASTSIALTQLINGTFSFTSTGAASLTVLAGQTTSTTGSYAFLATPTSAGTFGATVTFACGFAPTDPTLTNSSCTFSPTSIAAGAGATSVTMTITTKGPNTGTGQPGPKIRQRRADNRSPWLPLTLPLAGIVAVGFTGRKVWKHSAVASLCVSLMLLGLLVACGGNTAAPIIVGVSPGTALYPNDTADGWPSQTESFTATVTGTSNAAVTWSLSSSTASCPTPYTTLSQCGQLSSTTTSPVTYTAPTIAPGLPSGIVITATSAADTTKSGQTAFNLTPATVPGTYGVTVTATEGATSAPSGVSLVVN
jgi:subtilase family serine protease